MECEPGDVILVPFKFADEEQAKRRPAVIVSVAEYHASRSDAVMVALTTQKGRHYFGDCPIVDWKAAGLPQESTAKGVVRTIERALITHRLGSLTTADLERVRDSLRAILGLGGPHSRVQRED
jgi:mRNA interferase MazF